MFVVFWMFVKFVKEVKIERNENKFFLELKDN